MRLFCRPGVAPDHVFHDGCADAGGVGRDIVCDGEGAGEDFGRREDFGEEGGEEGGGGGWMGGVSFGCSAGK